MTPQCSSGGGAMVRNAVNFHLGRYGGLLEGGMWGITRNVVDHWGILGLSLRWNIIAGLVWDHVGIMSEAPMIFHCLNDTTITA